MLVGRPPSFKRLDSGKGAQDAEAPAREGASGVPASGTLDIPARPGSSVVLTQHSSGSLPVTASVLDGRGSSLDLGLLPPREMQVRLVPRS